MRSVTFIIFFTIFFSACSTKVDDTIQNSNNEDVSNLIWQLTQKEKEMNDIIKELEQCNKEKK